MSRILWMLFFILPPWAAIELDAPKWLCMLCAVPFVICAASLNEDNDEYLLGEGFAKHRPTILIGMLVGGIALGVVLLSMAKALL